MVSDLDSTEVNGEMKEVLSGFLLFIKTSSLRYNSHVQLAQSVEFRVCSNLLGFGKTVTRF